ncbi:MAG TPA: glucoamylase family protein, partial [Pararhizobium sp.]|nr:glucoamylase family protein [Pararhizobium sp.]
CYVAHMHSMVSLKSLSAFIEGYQATRTLQIGELWAVPSILRFVLIENLRRISHRVERERRMRSWANEVADRLLKLGPEESCTQVLDDIESYSDDNTFAAQLLYRLRDGSQTSKEAIAWLEDQLEARGSDAEEVLVSEHNRLAAGNVTMGNIVRSLRKIDDIDWAVWFEGMSAVDEVLRQSADFAELDFASRDRYRKAVEKLAQRCTLSEIEVARKALELSSRPEPPVDAAAGRRSNDIGFFLVGKKRPVLEAEIGYRQRIREVAERAYARFGWTGIAGPIGFLSLVFLGLAAWFLVAIGLSAPAVVVLLILFALPASEAASGLFNALASLVLIPNRLIGYEFKEGIPESARTLVVIPCLIGSKDTVDELVRNLEVHYLATTRGEVYFALLSDWPDSSSEESAADLDVLKYARAEVARLNVRYAGGDGNRFFLLHRRRLYDPSEGVWMGWERKRGKLHELNALLRGDPDTTFMAGQEALPDDVHYIMTLDADTRLTRDAVTKLVGKMAHPTNAPVFDPAQRTVTSGHGILQPRVTPSLTTGEEASAFQRIFSINRGLDPYVFTVSDVYQDLLGEGSFTGKGLYHIDTFEGVMEGRIGENTVLSHDLLEGSLARCGLATDVELVEDFPTRYEVEVSRQHRWARGDWQLLPFIFNPSSNVPMIGRWKMFDNLRRSAMPVAWLAASVLGWCLMSVGMAAIWQAVLIFSLFVAPTLSLISGALPRRSDIVARAHLHSVFSEINAANAQVALRIVFIGHTACLMADAIARTINRVFVTRRHLLEWRTAAQAHNNAHGGVADYFRDMWQAPAVAAVALILAGLAGNSGFYIAIPFALLWALSPAVAWFVSQSAETEDRLRLSARSSHRLRQFARRTWRFFEQFANAENNYIPPDNFQEDPSPVVAHRTSPTNIGVYLLSTVSARDFGWIGLAETIERLEQTVATIDRMAKFRGHLFNWYDTRTLEPLLPRYVSSVDSGNLAGHLVAVSSACAEWAQAPSAHLDAGIEGIADTAAILSDCLTAIADDRKTVRPLRRRIEERISGFHSAIDSLRREPEFVSIRAINLTVLAREISRLTANLDREVQSPESRQLADWAVALFNTCEAHVGDSMVDPDAIEDLRQRLLVLRQRTHELAFGMDFSFLFREERRLLSIGYRVEEGDLDESCYDLLASEARLTSLFGIAKGDLPTEHWFRLGRPVVPVGSLAALISWSGSMFEYLMPPLVMQERQGGILNQSSVLAIKRQISYARGLGTPWGISESAFNARDHDLNYQYSNFGVPSLGLKRGLGQNAVIAPYASLLASQYAPEEALSNLERLEKLGALGRFGFHDAVDFTPTRVPEGATCAVVKNYMAHHQGMSIAAVANVIFNGRMRDRFHSDPVVEAAELLLQEKAPREIPILTVKREPEETKPVQGEQMERPEVRTVADPLTKDRQIVLLSNGHYSVMTTATGAGYAHWNGQAVTRWVPDPSEDRHGNFIFLRDTESNEWWSATAEPKQAPGEKVRVLFTDDKADFHKTVGAIRSEVECIVATENDAEGRKVTVYNDGETDRFIEVTSYAELVLGFEDADSAHPAFSKMFVKTEIGPKRDVIHAWRRKRSASDPDMHVAHLVVSGSGLGRETQAETDRRAFLGRGRALTDAAAFDRDARLTGSDGFTLDPIFSLRRVVRLPAGKKATLIFWTIAAPTRTEVENAVERYRYSETFQHETVHAWTRSQVQLRYVGITSKEAAAFQTFGRYLLYPDLQLRPDMETVRAGLASQSALWPLSISGDFPIFALRINDEVDLEIVSKALRAQEYLRGRGLFADLVIVNEKPSSYIQDMQNAIDAMCENARLRGQALGPRQHIFAVRRDLMEPETYDALISAARIVLHARNGKLIDQIARAEEVAAASEPSEVEARAAAERPRRRALAAPAKRGEGATTLAPVPDDLAFWNGYGGFAEDGRSYVVRLKGGEATPHPWINVMANGSFGFHVSAEGAGFTWSRNSRDFQLTPWSNDPVVNRPGETFHVVDRDSGRVSSPFAGLSDDPEQGFETRHALGHSTFRTQCDGLELELTQFVDPEDPVKSSRLRLKNTGGSQKRLRIYGFTEWVLGTNRARSAPFIVSEMDDETQVMTATNRFSIDYSDRIAFVACSGPLSSFTADRRMFIGSGEVIRPDAVMA